MSLPTAKARLLSHIAAAITASLLALALYWTADRFLDRNVQPISSSPSTTDNYLPNLGPDWGTQHVNLDRLSRALSDGTLVVLGSSELSSHDLRFVPYRFFPQELKVPTLAYGHAMFQSYGMVSVLESVADALTPNTRLVIMVSPAWFASGGQLPRSAFAEHVTGPVWDRLWDRSATREQMQTWIGANANWGLLWLLANGQMAEFKDKVALWWRTRSQPAPDRPRSALAVPAHKYVAWPSAARLSTSHWNELIEQAIDVEHALGSKNPYSVRDDYYQQYLASVSSPARNEFPDISPMSRPELGDLARLMALLQQRKVRAYFVIQPFNPKLILDVERFDPVAAAIKGMCERYDMGCLDLYSIPFAPGMVRDDMHLAELGWALADRGIAEFFSR
ncbi:D-alanyl-lipoteichoic acid biosynthesis protein DltD [Bordetella avium]|uniref:D-alanyl-lipoteichoic acid biosynthesis protein DltD n=1 Tax=Bordetella avium TaxID=521 RepID=UPI000E0C970B|nr:D-alanyl-lipoteichoic acid biosynthesis protein DltD [Bordetella avium]AZY50337.1 teichoic acid biosynthesis protein [Bordetella avium]AZY53731.1 teichoic acid biosynthesis protein [Bordetella avium]RIQ15495.1 teichoic acid biosynthesis protein [Bordetella avium]RIQ19698.1 teichoic acid biosynthesis protein [Bordetella avium]RIQ34278.1 teichoic acid biosynthesis protein [Bordetella avium]